jgi:hypothetical protein
MPPWPRPTGIWDSISAQLYEINELTIALLKKKKKQIGINHTREAISRARQPAGQVEGEQ